MLAKQAAAFHQPLQIDCRRGHIVTHKQHEQPGQGEHENRAEIVVHELGRGRDASKPLGAKYRDQETASQQQGQPVSPSNTNNIAVVQCAAR